MPCETDNICSDETEKSIYSDNLQRTLVVELIQERINYLEVLIDEFSDKDSVVCKYNVKQLNSLKDFLLFYS